MKKTLLVLVFAVATIGYTKAQIGAICFTDIFGYVHNVMATKTAIGHWEFSGTSNIGAGTDWITSGSFDKETDMWILTVTNPAPDGCTFYVDEFSYYSTSYGGGTISFSWESYCFGAPLASGTGSTTWYNDPCVMRTGEGGAPTGPSAADVAVATMPVSDVKSVPGGMTLPELFTEAELSVVNNGNNSFNICYDISDASNIAIDIYNISGQLVSNVVNAETEAGFYCATWDASDAVPGMYLAVMKTDAGSYTYKFVK